MKKYNRFIIIQNSNSTFGANQLMQMKYLAERLREQDYQVILVFPVRCKGMQWNSQFPDSFYVNYTAVNMTPLEELIKKIDGGKSETILCWQYVEWRMIAAVQRFKGNLPLILHFHNTIDDAGMKGFIKKMIFKTVYRNTVNICVGEDVAESLERNIIPSKCKTYVVQNGIDFEKIRVVNEVEWMDSSKFNMLILGVHEHRKGVDLAVKAVEKLTDDGIKDLRLYVIAEKPEKARAFVNDCLPDKTLNEFIECIPTRADIGSYYRNASLLLSLSREEGFNCAICEASWAGLEGIATKCVGQRNNKTKDVCWINDPTTAGDDKVVKELVEQIKKLHSMWKRNELGKPEILKQRRKFVEDVYSLENWGNQMIDIINAIE